MVATTLKERIASLENRARRPDSPSYDALVDHITNSHSDSGENEIRFAGNGHNPRKIDSSSEMNRLSGEPNQRIAQEMNDLMSSVSSQIRKAIGEAIKEKVLPQIQASLRSSSRKMPQNGWNVPTERPEFRFDVYLNHKVRSS